MEKSKEQIATDKINQILEEEGMAIVPICHIISGKVIHEIKIIKKPQEKEEEVLVRE